MPDLPKAALRAAAAAIEHELSSDHEYTTAIDSDEALARAALEAAVPFLHIFTRESLTDALNLIELRVQLTGPIAGMILAESMADAIIEALGSPPAAERKDISLLQTPEPAETDRHQAEMGRVTPRPASITVSYRTGAQGVPEFPADRDGTDSLRRSGAGTPGTGQWRGTPIREDVRGKGCPRSASGPAAEAERAVPRLPAHRIANPGGPPSAGVRAYPRPRIYTRAPQASATSAYLYARLGLTHDRPPPDVPRLRHWRSRHPR